MRFLIFSMIMVLVVNGSRYVVCNGKGKWVSYSYEEWV
jgi:hypothetical protein